MNIAMFDDDGEFEEVFTITTVRRRWHGADRSGTYSVRCRDEGKQQLQWSSETNSSRVKAKI